MHTDVAVVGAGIVGLAHAWAAARRGKSVKVFERNQYAQGASIRNFGMVWPIGQPPGEMLELALLSRHYWMQVGEFSDIWVRPCGSIHVAYEEDEHAVLEEFAQRAAHWGYDCELLSPEAALSRYPALQPDGLRVGLYSRTECVVDPRQAILRLPDMLRRRHNVEFEFGSTIVEVESGRLRNAAGSWHHADEILVCSGTDFETLFPSAFVNTGIRRCKLQMMRTPPQPSGWRLGTHLAGGLTLCHYTAFGECPSLPKLRQRIAEQMPSYVKYGIHVMASQNELGEVIIGDSHEYEDEIELFDKEEIDTLILNYLRRMLRLPDDRVTTRWHGIYAKHPTSPIVSINVMPGVDIRVAPGGAGMTLSFGLGEKWFAGRG